MSNRKLKAHRIRDQIKSLCAELARHQDRCKHVKATKEYKANTGNYDPSADSYWIEFECPTCLSRWSEPQ